MDTLLEIHGSAGQLAVNDDRGGGRVDSYTEFAVESDQTIFVVVQAIGGAFGPYEFGCDFALPSGGGTNAQSGIGSQHRGGEPAGTTAVVSSQEEGPGDGEPAGITTTVTISESQIVSLTVRPVGEVAAIADDAVTAVRLIIYYDANNDRQPSPGEGVPNVSVVAVGFYRPTKSPESLLTGRAKRSSTCVGMWPASSFPLSLAGRRLLEPARLTTRFGWACPPSLSLASSP